MRPITDIRVYKVARAEALTEAAKTDSVLAWMLKTGKPLTREYYLSNAFWEPPNLDAEGEATLPEIFRREPVEDGGTDED